MGQKAIKDYCYIAAKLAVLVALVSAFLASQSQLILQNNQGKTKENQLLLSSESADVSSEYVERVRDSIGMSPIHQGLLNVNYVLASRSGDLMPQERQKYLEMAGKLGWRNSSYLQNRIANDVRRQNIQSIIPSVDALLRRGKFSDEILDLLFLAENDKNSQEKVIEHLSLLPNWRLNFFGDKENLQKQNQLSARVVTINRMISENRVLLREEVWPTIDALEKNQKFETLFSLVNSYMGTERERGDSKEQIAAEEIGPNRTYAFPNEWRGRKGNGYSSTIQTEQGKNVIKIKWNGRGRPTLLQKLIDVKSQQNVVIFSGDFSGLTSPDRLQVSVRCVDGHDAIFAFDELQSSGDRLAFRSRQEPNCRYPYFRLVGKGAFGTNDQSLTVKKVEILAK